eukprot:305194_1
MFFDPIQHCDINLEKESRIHMKTKKYLNEYELLKDNEVDLNGEETKYIKSKQLEAFLQSRAINNGYTMQKEVSTVMGLALQDHLKNMMDQMDKWRRKRIDTMRNHEDRTHQYEVKKSEMDVQQWIDTMNDKYSVKQQIFEAKDEIEALETEKTDLDFKNVTGLLTDEEVKRRDKLDDLIRKVKAKQKRNDQLKADFSLAALGGDFSFNFGRDNDKNKNKKKRGRQLGSEKFYVIDVINMMENHQKYNQ